jgi:nitroreductase
MNLLSPSTLVAQLRWRYATKKFDPTRRIPADQWDALEWALILTPSSFGLQPWKFVVVTDPVVKEKLSAASWEQTQPRQCSHMVVMARRQNLSDADIDRFLDRTAAVRGIERQSLAGYRRVIVSFRQEAETEGWLNAWAERQVYIALGNFISSAAMLGIDTCPMEGLDAARYDNIVGLEGTGYSTVVGCAAGYRAADDKYSSIPKVRFEAGDVIAHV